jgi:hypothetical protein
MATKDANLASDYEDGFLFIADSNEALYEIELGAAVTFQPGLIEELFLIDIFPAELALELGVTPHSTGLGSGTYRMRGFDTNGSVNAIVYWNSATADSTAEDYTGSAGPVVNIIISDIVGD